jgi:two-component system NtrC family sensor kinase
VTDSGIGISRENAAHLFEYGFTTKKKGHGFGLHGGAVSAKEMGGKLTALSRGTGKGATFILELPVRCPRPVEVEA